MSEPTRRAVLLACLGTAPALAGCLSGSSPGASSSTTTAPPTTTSPTTTTVEPCEASTPAVDVPDPEKPEPLTAETALDAVVRYEKAYSRASVEARYDVVRYSAYVVDRATGVEETDDGYRVTVKVHADYASTGNESGMAVTASGGYRHTYRVTDRRFVREGTTVACWGPG